MNVSDIRALAQGLAPAVHEHVQAALGPLLARIGELEKQLAAKADRGLSKEWEARFDAYDAKLNEVVASTEQAASAIENRLEAAQRSLDAWRTGDQFAKRLSAEDVDGMISAAIEALPKPEKGASGDPGPPGLPGEKGADGADGADGRDGASAEDLRPMVEELVAAAMATIPVPKDGRDGVDGKDGQPGEKGEAGPAGEKGDPGEPGERGDPGPAGERGIDGKDGVGLAGALISREGSLILTMTDGRTCDLGFVVGKDGRDGSDGKDGERGPAGFSLDSFDTEMKDGGRTLVLKFASGDTTETHELGIDAMIYRGVFKQGSEYERGDVVTWGGSLWHCNQPTGAKPDDSRDGVPWSMAVRRGRDGKDGEKGQKGDPGPKGTA